MPDLNAVNIRMVGFDENDQILEFAKAVSKEIIDIGRTIDLSCLDAVTIPYDYRLETASFDRGFEGFRPITVSNDQFIGVAVTTEVLRDKTAKSHIIFDSRFIVAIRSQELEDYTLAKYIIAHECAHVEVNSWFRSAFPDDDLDDTYPSSELISRWSVISACWNEYAACRLSAQYGPDETDRRVADFRQSLANMHELIRSDLHAGNMIGSPMHLQNTMYVRCGNLLKMASYMLGHLDGLSDEARFRQIQEEAKSTLFNGYLERLSASLRSIWDSRREWTTKDDFLEIGDIAIDLIRNRGVEIRPLVNGAFVRLVDVEMYF